MEKPHTRTKASLHAASNNGRENGAGGAIRVIQKEVRLLRGALWELTEKLPRDTTGEKPTPDPVATRETKEVPKRETGNVVVAHGPQFSVELSGQTGKLEKKSAGERDG